MAKAEQPGKRSTIYDVAIAASVSHQTVSRYLKGESNIDPQRSLRIEGALKELDYRPNFTARNLAKQRSSTIGVLTFDIAEHGPSRTILGIVEVARETGFLADLISLAPGDHESLESALRELEHRDLVALLVLAPNDALVSAIQGVALPLATYVWQEADDRVPGKDATVNELGVQKLVEHLYQLGHRRFFALHGPRDWVSARHRSTALTSAVAGLGGTLVGEAEGDWTARSGYEAVLSAANLNEATALVCANDQMALGALMALRERGIDVPGEMSVVGFDDIPESEFFFPPLTTINQDFVQQGRVAMSRLLSLLDPNVSRPAVSQTEPRLVVRASTGEPGSAS